MKDWEIRIELCNTALAGVRDVIPTGLFGEVHDFINRFNEWGIGIELLIDQLIELDVKISCSQFSRINAAMTSMGLDDDIRLAYLKKTCVRSGEGPDITSESN